MSDLNKPIRPVKRDDKERLRVQKIEGYKQKNSASMEDYDVSNNKHNTKTALGSSILFFFKKILNRMIPEKAGSQGVLSHDSVLVDIRNILNLLITIRDEDPSNDPNFAKSFSTSWHNLAMHFFSSTKGQTPTSANIKKVNEFLQMIHHFPENDEHNLAFYLQKYTEEEWFPIPFFKLIQQLHDEFLSAGEKSHLYIWIRHLQNLLGESKGA